MLQYILKLNKDVDVSTKSIELMAVITFPKTNSHKVSGMIKIQDSRLFVVSCEQSEFSWFLKYSFKALVNTQV